MSTSDKYWYKEQALHSLVKSKIVADYLPVWGTIVGSAAKRLVYLDLFAGRGEFQGGEPSTPLLVLDAVVKQPKLRNKLLVILNDKEEANCKHLRNLITSRGYAADLKYPPQVIQRRVDLGLAQVLDRQSRGPTFCFIDPFGFKGLTSLLVRSVIKEWGCDCLVFLNTKGIVRDVRHPKCLRFMVELFGEEVHKWITSKLDDKGRNKGKLILEGFRRTSVQSGAKFFLPFAFSIPNSSHPSHHLVFLTKSIRGFSVMKDVMAKYSHKECGIPKFVYYEGSGEVAEQTNFRFCCPMEHLRQELLTDFRGQTVQVGKIVDQYDNQGRYYLSKNIKNALLELEKQNLVVVQEDPSGRKRQRGKMPDWLRVTFVE